MATRIYVVTDAVAAEAGKQAEVADRGERLVEASTPAQAIKHCASRFSAAVASQRDIARLCGAGTKVEAAGE